MKAHHLAWLAAHPERTAEWLAERTGEGFDVHHLDGDHGNNEPDNLALIEASDHMRLHGGRMEPRSKKARALWQTRQWVYQTRQDTRKTWLEIAKIYGLTVSQCADGAKAYALKNNAPWPI